MNTATNVDGLHCMPWLNEMIRKFILVAKEIQFFVKPSSYFRRLYAKYLRERMKNNHSKGFLDTAECRIINTIFREICDFWVLRGDLQPSKPLLHAHEISENDVISIRCPSLFASYHFILAVVGKTTVDIYQSYGYSRPLYKIKGIPVSEFKRLVENMSKLDGPDAMEKIKEIEEKVYGTNYESKMQQELKELNRSGDSDGIEIDMEELEMDLFYRNVKETRSEFKMDVYKYVESKRTPTPKQSRKRARNIKSEQPSKRRRTNNAYY